MERAICEEDPEKPSAAIDRAEGDATPQSVSETREGTPDKLRRRLRGDLDNIVLMALRKEPLRRYSSVLQFSEDIRRHLEGLPVMARRDTPGYRAAKFVGRHKTGVAAAALIFLSLALGIVATLRQTRIARAERDRAQLEKAKADRINAFLQDMLSFSSPAYVSSNPRKDPDAKVSEVVEEAARRAESELADQPEVLAEMQRTIGEVYYAQGRYDPAEQILRAALEKYSRLYGPGSYQSIEASNMLANVLLRKGSTAEAEALFRSDIEIARKEMPRGHLDVRTMAYVLGDYGSMLDQRADKATAGYILEALQYASRLTGKDRAYVAMLDNDLGDVAYRSGDFAEAERLNRAAIAEYRKLPEGTYVEMAASLSNLGAVLIKQGKYDEAEPFVREGLELRRKMLGNAHPDTAMSLFRLSDLLYKKGDYQNAESAARESVQVFSRALTTPKDNPYFANPLMELGLILNRIGRSREGEDYLRESLAIRTHLLPAGNQLIAATKGALGECLTTQKRYAAAETLLSESYVTLKSVQGEQSPPAREAARRLATLYQSWGKPEKAAPYLATAPSSSPTACCAHTLASF
jgi:serine/threonine-protein kinase